MLKLLGKISLVVILALMLSLGVDYLYRQTHGIDYKWPENVLLSPDIPEKYEIVGLGNSHSQNGLTFEKYKVKSLFLASVAQSFEYDLAMLKMHSKQIKKDAVIIINVSPLSFSQNRPDNLDDANMNYYDGRLSPFLIPHLKLFDYLQIQIMPFVRSGYLWREEYAKSKKDIAMSVFAKHWEKEPEPTVEITTTSPVPEVTIVPILPIAKARSTIPSFNVEEIQAELNALPEPTDDRLIESSRLMVEKWYKSGSFSTEAFDGNKKDLEAIISYSLDHGWRPILITLPISQVLLDKLEPNYMQQYVYDNLNDINLYGIKYFNFTSNTQLTKNKYLFGNSDHLNPKGAAITSYLLLKRLIDAGYLPKEADGYDYKPSRDLL